MFKFSQLQRFRSQRNLFAFDKAKPLPLPTGSDTESADEDECDDDDAGAGVENRQVVANRPEARPPLPKSARVKQAASEAVLE